MHIIFKLTHSICIGMSLLVPGLVFSEDSVNIAVVSLLGNKALEVEPTIDSNGEMRVKISNDINWGVDLFASNIAVEALEKINGYTVAGGNKLSNMPLNHHLETRWTKGLFRYEYVPGEEIKRIKGELGVVNATLLMVIAHNIVYHDSDNNNYYTAGFGIAYYPTYLNVFVKVKICIINLDDLKSKGCSNAIQDKKLVLTRPLSLSDRQEILEYIQLDLKINSGQSPYQLLFTSNRLGIHDRDRIVISYITDLARSGMFHQEINDRSEYLKELLTPVKIHFGELDKLPVNDSTVVEETVKNLIKAIVESETYDALIRVDASE